MKLVVTISAFNEEKTIGKVLDEIPKKIKGIDKIEFIVVDDGSTDKTVSIAKGKGAKVLLNITNKGLAYSFKRALGAAIESKADIIVNTDADFQYNQKQIPDLIKPILEKRAELVLGSRFKGKIESMPAQKRIGNQIASKVLSFITGLDISDGQTGFRAFSREAALRMNIFSTYTYTQETIMQAAEKRISIMEIPIVFRKRNDDSRLISNIFIYAINSLKTIYTYYVIYKPMVLFGVLAFIFGVLGLLAGIKPLASYLETGLVTFIPSTILAASLIMISIFFVLNGLNLEDAKHIRLLQEEILYEQKK